MVSLRQTNRFDKSVRLVNKTEFNHVFRRNNRYYLSGLTVLARKNDLDHSRIGFSITKKKIKTASKRNLIRRLFREYFRTSPLLHSKQLDLIVLANDKLTHLSSNELKKECKKSWENLLKKFAN